MILTLGFGCFGLTPANGSPAGSEGLTIISMDPDHGPLAGGARVTVTGTEFTESTSFYFGRVETEAEYLDAHTLEVYSPPYQSEDTVDVKVTDADESFTLDDAFTFTDNPD